MTLVELILVITIAGILAVVAVPSYNRYILKARNTRAIADLAEINMLIGKFRLDNSNALPSTLAAIGAGGRKDPWGRGYVYLKFSALTNLGSVRKDRNLVPINSEFDLYSKGKDGQSVPPLTAAKSRDDIIVANNGDYIGLASDY